MNLSDYVDRLWPKIDVAGPDACWIWMGAAASGNPVLTINYKTISARRMMWEITREAPPKGRQVHTTCGEPLCLNPGHLWISTIEVRLQRNIEQCGLGECWPWMAGKTKAGYGVINEKGKLLFVHRLAWEGANGPLPKGKHVLHSCDNPACCNPSHLFLGSQRSNMADKVAKGRQAKGESSARSKLTGDKVREIRFRLNMGVPASRLGRDFGVHKSTIMDIKHGRTWKHVS